MKTGLDCAPFHEVTLPPRSARLAAGQPLPLAMVLLGSAPGALDLVRKLTVAVIGCGSVGGRIAILLARMGLGGLLLVDPKSYKRASLTTHDISPQDVGQPKAMVVAQRCKAVSPASRVLAYVGPIEALALAALADLDLVVMAPDLLSVEVELGQRCLWLGKTLVQASVHGPTLTVQIRFFRNANGADGCPVCGYGSIEMELLSRQARFSCDGAAEAAVPSAADAPATNSISALCSLGGDLAVIQVLRFLLKLGQPVANTMLEYCCFSHRTVITPISRNPKCKLQHTRFGQAILDVPLAGLSLAQMTQRATGGAITPDAQFEVAGLDWVEFAACGCARPTPVRQFVPRGHTELSRCPKCSTRRVPLSFYTHRMVSNSVLGSAADVPLNKLGGRRVTSVLVRSGESGVLVRSQPATSIML